MATSTRTPPALTPRQRTENILWHALAVEAGRRANRDALVDGSAHQVAATIEGKVGRAKVSLSLQGELTVGAENPTGSSSGPSTAPLVAHLLAIVPEEKRPQICAHLKRRLDEAGKLIEPPAELLALAKQILGELKKVGPKRGAVQFRPTEEAT